MKSVIALALLLAAGPVFAGIIEGRVIEVSDGATVTVLANEGASMHRVRLAGINAPKINRAYGSNSRESLRRLAVGKTVRVETTGLDPKGFLIGVVLVVRGARECGDQPCPPILDPGLSQLSSGWAVIDKANLVRQSDAAQKQYSVAEAQAKASRRGLWREPNFMLHSEVVQTR